jgi:hypothetical protein
MAAVRSVKVSPVTVSKAFDFPSPKPWKDETFGTLRNGDPTWTALSSAKMRR